MTPGINRYWNVCRPSANYWRSKKAEGDTISGRGYY